MASDVCMILEGCHPFVTGGVSSWVQMLISNLPELSFSILVISPDEKEKEARYKYPPNIKEVVEVAIEQRAFLNTVSKGKASKETWQEIEDFHEEMSRGTFSSIYSIFDLVLGKKERAKLDIRSMLTDRRAFDIIRHLNNRFGRLSPLLDYFHTWRATHFPLMHLLRARIPQARVYHSISTGFAGFLGALAKWKTGAPYLLTEHGIYTKEREMEIMRADWIADHQKPFWIRFFNGLGRLTYESADEVIALFEVNRQLQISLGAEPAKCKVIPNGISIEKYTSPVRKADDGIFRVGLVGRVTKIKDIKTFIKACALVARNHPNTEFSVLGPWEEEPEYAQECRFLTRDLGIDRQLQFPGKVDVRKWYPKLDCLVLSSVKEAQPLVLIEAMCAGVPTVATRVGGVAEILEGCGQVVNAKRPTDMAKAIERYIVDQNYRHKCIQHGIERAKKVFSLERMITNYRNLYGSHLDGVS